MSDDILKIKQQIKDWEHGFKGQNGRLPTKSDIHDNPSIKALYSRYRSIKSNKQPVTTKAEMTSKDDENDKENLLPTPNGELGPTPQANGRVLSIFDFKLTPPESSPLKNKSVDPPEVENDFDSIPLDSTPVRTKRRLSFSTPTRASADSTPTTITKKLQLAAETPRYLKSTTTPTFNRNVAANFSISPSPLKPNRLGRKLMDVYNMSIQEIDEPMPEELIDLQEAGEAEEAEGTESASTEGEPIVRRKTQKRQTRRSKMAPRPVMEMDSLDKVDVQQKMVNLEEKERHALAAYMNSDSESESDASKADNTQGSPVKRTRKPIAQNYKRLKINDPRSRRFKQRMRR
ncbi:SLD2 [Candida margitis]|uniref:SLD2 n=1 Tax=Candida margitis TaxID=1775924 RepID=UPI00222678AE|nr:SLD2 [Candida margitis]KAI5967694.1 SLD2 [Candida margitis]